MATETVANPIDYLGHPCQLSEALVELREPFLLERPKETRALVRQIGRGITRALERNAHILAGIELAIESLPNSSDTDHVRALLTMAAAYGLESNGSAGGLYAQMLVALERGNLIEGDAASVAAGAQTMGASNG